MKFNSKTAYMMMLGLCVLIVGIIIATVVVGDSYLSRKSARLTELKLDTEIIDLQQNALIEAKKDIASYSELNNISKQVVPQDKDQARAVREIISVADQSGIGIASVTFPSSTLGKKPAATKQSGGSNEPQTPTTQPANPLTQAVPVKGLDGLYQLEIAVASDPAKPASYAKLIDFLERLENNRRTAQVAEIVITPTVGDRKSLNFTLTLTVYIKP